MDKYSFLIENAKQLIPVLEPITQTTSYEEKGILYSEFLFMAACLYGKKVNRILESGRARGQSTLLLAKTFPETTIVSIEFDKNSIDVPIATERLKNYKNVSQEFGDSMTVLPQIVQTNDVVIIDGPKMFLAVRLALKLLASKKVTHVFIHDLPQNDPCRDFLDRFLPESLYSDFKKLGNVTQGLDKDIIEYIPPGNRIGGFEGEYGYGYTLGCVPYNPQRSYYVLYYVSFIYDFLHSDMNILYRLIRKVKNIFS